MGRDAYKALSEDKKYTSSDKKTHSGCGTGEEINMKQYIVDAFTDKPFSNRLWCDFSSYGIIENKKKKTSRNSFCRNLTCFLVFFISGL